jgi:hypothetical protein
MQFKRPDDTKAARMRRNEATVPTNDLVNNGLVRRCRIFVRHDANRTRVLRNTEVRATSGRCASPQQRALSTRHEQHR